MFNIVSNKNPAGDQKKSIPELLNNFNNGIKKQVLLGATGTGKTFTIANIISSLKKKTLVLAPNKTLAAQLYAELKELFPNDYVEYFVSYFDFYQPEAFVVKTGTYIEKSSKVNSQIEMMRLSTFNSLVNHKNTIVVASVASIYSASDPNEFKKNSFVIDKDSKFSSIKKNLVKLNYKRNDIDLQPGFFRIKGDVLEIAPSIADKILYRISFFGEDVESIDIVDSFQMKKISKINSITIPLAKEYIPDNEKLNVSISRIKEELKERIKYFNDNNMLVEAQRIKERTEHDIESILELGYCNGIENYSRHLELRESGETPFSLFDYFNDDNDWLLVIDESHMMIPQIHGMHNTDKSRKTNLVDYGFRLPSALDNRPLTFEEYYSKLDKVIYVSATPNEWEIEDSNNVVVEQIVRPTGLLDPEIKVLPSKDQILKILEIIKENIKKKERTIITVLTIRMAEELTSYLMDNKIKAHFIHNDIKTIERVVILNKLRKGIYDVIIGINLLREGIDLPEVSSVIIVDADKPGFFRNEKSLIQTIGRASRNQNGKVYMFGDERTDAMNKAIEETERRRNIQIKYNIDNNITPQTVSKPIYDDLSVSDVNITNDNFKLNKNEKTKLSSNSLDKIRKEMEEAAKNQDYERAAYLRDIIIENS